MPTRDDGMFGVNVGTTYSRHSTQRYDPVEPWEIASKRAKYEDKWARRHARAQEADRLRAEQAQLQANQQAAEEKLDKEHRGPAEAAVERLKVAVAKVDELKRYGEGLYTLTKKTLNALEVLANKAENDLGAATKTAKNAATSKAYSKVFSRVSSLVRGKPTNSFTAATKAKANARKTVAELTSFKEKLNTDLKRIRKIFDSDLMYYKIGSMDTYASKYEDNMKREHFRDAMMFVEIAEKTADKVVQEYKRIKLLEPEVNEIAKKYLSAKGGGTRKRGVTRKRYA